MEIKEGMEVVEEDEGGDETNRGIISRVDVLWEGNERPTVTVAVKWKYGGTKEYPFSEVDRNLSGNWWDIHWPVVAQLKAAGKI